MTAIAADRVPRQAPHRNHDTLPSFLAALAMHGALVAALWIAMRWHTGASAPVTATLWNLPPMPVPHHAVRAPTPPKVVPQPQPPAPPPPPPKEERLPSKADIVEKKTAPTTPKPPPQKTRENHRHHPHKAAKAAAEAAAKAQAAAERARLDKAAAQEQQQEMQELNRLANQAATATPRSATIASSGMSRADANVIGAAIKAHLFFAVPPDVADSVYAEYEVHVLPTGQQVGDPLLIKPSGLPGFDEAALRAILAVNPFPRKDGQDLPRTIDVKLYPKDAH